MNIHSLTPGVQLALRASVAAALSLAIAQTLKLEFPIYAFIAAVIVTDLTPSQSRALGLRRMAATAVGAVCGAALTPYLSNGPWSLGAGILIAMLACHVVGARDGARVAGYICGIVILDHSHEPWTYAFYRFIETVIGVAVAWMISYVPKLIRQDENEATKS